MNEQQTTPTALMPCKVYHDGGHYVALPHLPERKKRMTILSRSDERQQFDDIYDECRQNGEKYAQIAETARTRLNTQIPDETARNEFVAAEMKRRAHNNAARKKRFRRKAYLNTWSYFVTLTYADEKHDEQTFRKALRKCLSNLHSRRQWLYMGVFERAPETDRLHFHGLVYVPDGQMIGTLAEISDYSTKQHGMQTRHENTFFASKYGRNDFDVVNGNDIKLGNTLAYLLKYISKSGERLIYSRGIPDHINAVIADKDIAAEMTDYGTKFVLFDDVRLPQK